jgi:hypothetical protein
MGNHFLQPFDNQKDQNIMKFGFSMAIAGAICMGLATPAAADPVIIATKVVAQCKILPDGTATTVEVTLNNVTSSFYGQSLFFKFTPTSTNSGTFQNLQFTPNPPDVYNPVNLAVSPGVYKLEINTQSGPGGSSSALYDVTVPAGIVKYLGSRKFCMQRNTELKKRI